MSLFYSFVKKSSMKHGIANKSVVLIVYVSLLTTQPVPVNLIQPGLILSKSYPFLGASLDSITTNVDNLANWEEEIKCPSSNFDQSINYVLRDKKFYLEKANGNVQLKKPHKYFY